MRQRAQQTKVHWSIRWDVLKKLPVARRNSKRQTRQPTRLAEWRCQRPKSQQLHLQSIMWSVVRYIEHESMAMLCVTDQWGCLGR